MICNIRYLFATFISQRINHGQEVSDAMAFLVGPFLHIDAGAAGCTSHQLFKLSHYIKFIE